MVMHCFGRTCLLILKHAEHQTVSHKPHRPQLCRNCLSCLVQRAFSFQLRPASFSAGLHIATEGAVNQHTDRSKVALVHPEPVLSPESLPLHDVPQLSQVGLGNDIIRFELQRTQVIGLCFRKFPVQVEDGTEVH